MITPNEFFEAERLRRYEQLLMAGIEDDRAWEVAHQAALDITEKKIAVIARQPMADDYENSPNVYGSAQ